MAERQNAITTLSRLEDPSAAESGLQDLVGRLSADLKLNDESKANIATLLAFFVKDVAGWTDGGHVAYALATAYHETGVLNDGQYVRFAPVTEVGAKPYFDKYEPKTKIGKVLGNTRKGDGFLFRGRGYTQITGRANYKKFSEIAGHDLIEHPDKALDPATAYLIMREGMTKGLFTGRKLGDYIAGDKMDFVNARRIINGLDRAMPIARIASQIDKILNPDAE